MTKIQKILQRFNEAFLKSFNGNYGEYTEIFINPSRSELLSMGSSIRFIVLPKEEKLIVWDANAAIHSEVCRQLKLNMKRPGMITGEADYLRGALVVTEISEFSPHSREDLAHDFSWTEGYGLKLSDYIAYHFNLSNVKKTPIEAPQELMPEPSLAQKRVSQLKKFR